MVLYHRIAARIKLERMHSKHSAQRRRAVNAVKCQLMLQCPGLPLGHTRRVNATFRRTEGTSGFHCKIKIKWILSCSSVSSVSWSSRTPWLGRGSSFSAHFPLECSYFNRLKEPHWPSKSQRCCSPAALWRHPHLVGLVGTVGRSLEMEGLHRTAHGFRDERAAQTATERR